MKPKCKVFNIKLFHKESSDTFERKTFSVLGVDLIVEKSKQVSSQSYQRFQYNIQCLAIFNALVIIKNLDISKISLKSFQPWP